MPFSTRRRRAEHCDGKRFSEKKNDSPDPQATKDPGGMTDDPAFHHHFIRKFQLGSPLKPEFPCRR
jgi:hypothetical protein